jgi:hypothetical protein
MSFSDHQFQPGREKTGGRKLGTRNKIGEAFLKDLLAEWEKSGPETLRILAKENPEALAKLTAALLPKQYDDELPPVVRIITGVPRGDEMPEPVVLPALPQVLVPQIPVTPRKDD